MKVACTVLEGESGGNPADLLRLENFIVQPFKPLKAMGIKVKAVERDVSFDKNSEKWRRLQGS